jgi:excisionase family DNA binding protein
LTARQPAKVLFSKCCDDFITTSLPQNGKTQSNAMDASESKATEQPPQKERIAYSIHEAADMLGVDYFSVYRLIQRGKLKACRALRGKFLISKTELFRLLNTE